MFQSSDQMWVFRPSDQKRPHTSVMVWASCFSAVRPGSLLKWAASFNNARRDSTKQLDSVCKRTGTLEKISFPRPEIQIHTENKTEIIRYNHIIWENKRIFVLQSRYTNMNIMKTVNSDAHIYKYLMAEFKNWGELDFHAWVPGVIYDTWHTHTCWWTRRTIITGSDRHKTMNNKHFFDLMLCSHSEVMMLAAVALMEHKVPNQVKSI